jgi:hypothetical protein
VRRLAHAHENDARHLAPGVTEDDLGDHFAAAHLTQQAITASHAEGAANGAADLRRDAQAVARQQHAFDGLTVGQFDEQARRAVLARVFGTDAG